MANGTAKGGMLQQTAPAGGGAKDMKQLILQMKPQIEKALPSVLTGERFTRMVLTAMSTTPELMQCSRGSFLGAMMQAAQLGVEPNTPLGQAYLIPYKNHGRLECQFQLGYKGLIDLAYRSGEITDIQAHEVHEADLFEFEYGLDPKLKHVPAMKDRGPVVAYYAVFHTKSGGHSFLVMSVDDIQEHKRKFSKAAGSGFSPWNTNFDSMAKKTVLKQLLKYAPIKTEFTRALGADETIKSNISPDMTEEPNEFVYTVEGEPVEAEQEAAANGEEPEK